MNNESNRLQNAKNASFVQNRGGGRRSSLVGLNPASRITISSLLAVVAVIFFSVLISLDSGAEVSSGATGSGISNSAIYGDSGSASLVSVPGIDENRGNVATTTAPSPIPLKQIDVGLAHACVLDSAGKVSCWGENASGQVSGWNMPYANETFSSVSAGGFFTCGTKSDGSALCWGYPILADGTNKETNMAYADWVAKTDKPGYTGWVNTPLPSDNVKFKSGTVSVGNYHACGIKTNGEATCWGKGGDDRLIVPKDSGGQTITDWVQLEAGWAQACGVRAGGSVVCWGRQSHGRSDGPSGNGPYQEATTAVFHGCALATDGSVDCWGRHTSLSVEYVEENWYAPVTARFTTIEMSTALSFYYGCGLLVDKSIQCWGSAVDLSVFSPPAGKFESISVGSANVCALDTEGYPHCWGASDGGLLTNLPSGAFSHVDGGLNYSCALGTPSGNINCWGADQGTGNLDAPSGSYAHFAVGEKHGCAINSSGVVTCWGGKKTDGTKETWAANPTGTFFTLDAGPDLTCGVKTDNTLHCWGDNTHTRLTAPSGNFTAVAVGATHVCAIKSDKSIECWGERAFFDKEGDGIVDDIDDVGNHTTTIPPTGTHEYKAITAGSGHTCAVRTDDKIVCWGYHADGRNKVPGWGYDTQGFSNVTFSAIATGGLTNCGIKSSDGGLSCWNDEKPQYQPYSNTLALTGFTKIGAGPTHMLAVKSDGSLESWGVANPSTVPTLYLPSAILQSVKIASDFQYIGVGNRLRFEASFDRPVVVEGIPQLSFMLDDATRYASYVGGNPSTTLYFEYVLQEDDYGKTRLATESSQLVFQPGSSIMATGTNRPTTTVPIETDSSRKFIYDVSQAKISRIEPSIRSATVGAGDRIRIGVDVYGAQNIKDNSLAEGIGFSWNDDGGGGSFDGNGREVTYTAPDQPGTYTVSVGVPHSACRAPVTGELRCAATFEIRVRRLAAPQPADEAPVNPPGEIPSILADSDGNQYEVFTPVEGGTFAGEGYSIVAPSGAVPNGEFIGVRMSDDGTASNVGMTHQRYTLGGNMYGVHVVDSAGASVSSYALEDPATVCVPLPAELRHNISDLAVVAVPMRGNGGDGSLTILSAKVRLSSVGTMVCGGLSNLPVSIAVGSAGAPAAIPTAVPEPTPEVPDTGGTAPSSNGLVWVLALGIAAMLLGAFIGVINRKRRRSSASSHNGI